MTVPGDGHRREFARRRKEQGFTQESLAASLRVERSTVVRWEAGRSAPNARLRPELAAALSVTSEQLTALLGDGSAGTDRYAPVQPSTTMTVSGNETDDHQPSGVGDVTVFHLRRILIGSVPDAPPSTPAELTASVTRVWDLFFDARFGQLGQMLPTVLASAYNAAEASNGETRGQVRFALAQLLHAAANLLGYVAQEDLAALALLRADALAADTGDKLTRAAIRGSHSWLLAKNGMYDDAVAFAEHAAVEVEPRLSTASSRHISIWGELLCYAAFAATRTGDHDASRRFLRLSESAGTQLEDDYASRPEPSNVFGQSSAASFAVINEIEANRPREALKLAVVARNGDTGIPPTLLSRRLVNLAQAQIHTRDDEAAVASLRQACSMAPELVAHIPLAHTLTTELLAHRGRHQLRGLDRVAHHLGLPAELTGERP